MSFRLVSLGHAGMKISFINDCTISLENYVKANSCFNHLKFYAFDAIFPGNLDSYESLKHNLNFHAERVRCTQS